MAATGYAQLIQSEECCIMELFRIDSNFFYRLVGIKCERETLEYVLREMEKVLEEELPDADKPTAPSLHQ